ncbi:MAG: EFR1 family ferrodoxin [Enterocloster sp.]
MKSNITRWIELIGIYLSGTGNTRHCIEKLTGLLDSSAESMPLESRGTVEAIRNNDTIILGYPTQFSSAPIWSGIYTQKCRSVEGKKLLCVSTMGAFSGDGAGCTARLLRKYGAVILGGLHIRMPDSVCDSKLLKKTLKQNREIIIQADKKIESAALLIKQGIYPKDGITFISHLAGLLGQRLWFYGKTADYTDKLKINKSCIGCGLCVSLCPMENISMKNGKAAAGKSVQCIAAG